MDQLSFLEQHDVTLRPQIEQILEAGPFAHSSRRIRREGSRGILAHKDYRICFEVVGRRIELSRIESGYAEQSSANADHTASLAVHREFGSTFGRVDLEDWLKREI
ncbi:MAG: hypothetical protein QM784_34470 [Polyangiaceae bacterium]